MALSATTDAQLLPQNVREFETNLRKLWNLGANLIVGWRTLAQGIEVLYIPSYNLPLIAKSRPDILRSDRHIIVGFVSEFKCGNSLITTVCSA
jgi:hypothetical protein